MATYGFQEKELQTGKTRVVFGCEMTDYDTPVTPRDNLLLALKGEPVWLPSTFDIGYLYPRCVPDNPAKGNVSDAKLAPEELGGFDMFGIEWEYVPKVGGSTTRPGNPLLGDASEWKEKVVFPTKEVIDSWDWEGAKESAKVVMREKDFWEVVICTGFFERQISFMDFENASIAMIDEVGPGGTYILEEHTAEHVRDFWTPRYLIPKAMGEGKDLEERLAAEALKIIEKGPQHRLPADKKAAIDAIMERVVARCG